MILLGLNHSNDAAAALIEDSRVTAASAEERFSRIKHDASFPHRSLRFVLEQTGNTLESCDAVAFFWNPVQQMDAANRRFSSRPRSHLEYLYNLPNQLLAGRDLRDLPYVQLTVPQPSQRPLQLFFIDHHLCHAAHAFFESPFEQAAILTVDGYGERASTLIARGQGNAIEPIVRLDFPHSIGSVYAAITQYLGFKPNAHEGKVMGLASYGTPRYEDLFDRLLQLTPDGFEVDLNYFSYFMDRRMRVDQRLIDLLGPARAAEAPIESRHQDIAASLQSTTERALLHLARVARRKTGLATLCVGGGVGLNCVANGRIAREAGFEQCFFQPACHDAGTSAGAGLYASHVILGQSRTPPRDQDRLPRPLI
jgi:carbamoyltransferase